MSLSYSENINRCMIWLSLIVYAISMFLPFCYIIECPSYYLHSLTLQPYLEIGNAASDDYNRGIGILFLGIAGLHYDIVDILYGEIPFGMIWLLNIIYFIAFIRIYRHSVDTSLVYTWMPLSILIIVLFYFCHDKVSDFDMGPDILIGQKGGGYYLWLLSFLILQYALSYEMKQCAYRVRKIYSRKQRIVRSSLWVLGIIIAALVLPILFILCLLLPMCFGSAYYIF